MVRSVSGNINELDVDISSHQSTTNYTLGTGGIWYQTGSGSGSSGTLDDRSYNGTGNYSYFPASGGEVTGNLNESGQRVSYTAAAWALALDAAGDWVTDNGTSTTTANTQDQLDYSGGGSYGPTDDPTVDHGTVIESGASASGTNYVVTALWNPGSSEWVNSSGSGSGNDTGYDYSFYLGSHTYTHPSDIYNNSVDGTVDDSGTHFTTSQASWNLGLLAGQIAITDGTGSSTGSVHDSYQYGGSGIYHRETNDSQNGTSSNVTGTLNELGSGFSDNGYTVASQWNSATQQWVNEASPESLGSGTSFSIDSTRYHSTAGSATYGYSAEGAPISGSINESGNQIAASNSTWQLQLDQNDDWQTTSGNGNTTGRTDDRTSYRGATGSDGYSHSIDGGTITGTISERGNTAAHTTYTVYTTWDPQNEVWKTAVDNGEGKASNGSGHSESTDDWSYHGSGNYSYVPADFGDALVSGTAKENGNHQNTSTADWDLAIDPNTLDWITTDGSAKSTTSSHDGSSYNGAGGYDRNSTQGSFADQAVGTFKENGNSNSSSQGTVNSIWDFGQQQWVALGADGGSTGSGKSSSASHWEYQSTSGSYTNNQSSNTFNPDTGEGSTYSQTVGGTVKENGHDNTNANATWSTAFVPSLNNGQGDWQNTTGNGSWHENTVDHYDYKGGGTYGTSQFSEPAGVLVAYQTTGGDFNDKGQSDSTSDYQIDSSIDSQSHAWVDVYSGSGQSTDDSHSDYNGSGSYYYVFDPSLPQAQWETIGGTVHENGNSDAVPTRTGITVVRWIRRATRCGLLPVVQARRTMRRPIIPPPRATAQRPTM